jgi:23S rRNA pseudouridine1911/1915/1917 synthase
VSRSIDPGRPADRGREAGSLAGTRVFRSQVGAEEGGQRLDRLLALRGFLPTRSRVAALVRAGLVKVDGVARRASFLVAPGQMIEVIAPPPEPSTVEPEAIPLEVLYEDESIVAVNKPPGMATHPAPGSRHGTLVAALLHRFGLDAEWPDPQRAGIVHRLDKDTTGVIVVAKTPNALHALARQFERRTVAKVYHALVYGAPRAARGEIDLAIGRDPISRQRMQARVGQRREARTAWRVLERFGGSPALAAWIEAEPRTGRTHQIRVHLASLGTPIVGDRLYAGERRARGGALAEKLDAFPRQALHASRIALRHPADGRVLEIVAPLPRDLAELLDELRRAGQHRIDERPAERRS